MPTLLEWNTLPVEAASAALARCCAASAWVRALVARRPFADTEQLHAIAAEVWAGLGERDWLEAFAGHPRIGADLDVLRAKYATTAQWSAGEQASVVAADEPILHALAEGNRIYEARFGFIFIVCATGKSAAEMLALLQARLPNDRPTELANAAAEQAHITRLRLEKLLS